MEDKDWIKGLENKLKDYEEPAPEGLWEDIESSVFPVKKRRVIPMPALWRSVAAAAVVALGVFAGIRFYVPGGDASDEPRENLASGKPSSVKNDGGQDRPVEIVHSAGEAAGAGTLLADSGQDRVRRKAVRQTAPVEKDAPVEAETNSVPDQIPEPEPVVEVEPDVPVAVEETAVLEDGQDIQLKKKAAATDHDGEDWSEYISATSDSRSSGRGAASLDVAFSGGTVDSRKESSYDLQMFYRGSAPASAPGMMPDYGEMGDYAGGAEGQTRAMAPMPLNSPTSAVSKSDHRRPVRLAVTVNYPISRTFGLETGVTFTTLRSTFSNETGRTLSETDQTLRYVGLPLNMTASIFDSRFVSLYVSAGGMAEKSVSGKSVTTETLGGVKQGDSVTKNLNVKPLLWSLNASAGLQVNLAKRIGLYAEPGLSYHFDDKSGVSTIYKDRPLDFSLTFGARFLLR